ncbi:MAG: UTP--glucose-1-phosphate uridylyltransferase [Clostridia bacterium]|nr:UTP--glucose-1-phosphate uridylyltransferase [Clostridia bacterium]
MDRKIEDIKKKLKKYGQEHLFQKFDEMNDDQKAELLNQIETIDFDLMKDLYEKAKNPVDFENITIEPIEHVDKSKLTVAEREMYEKKGIEAIKYNKLAVVTMAGGQGTRLGHKGPKGTYIFDPEKKKSIFEALCDTLKEAVKKYDTVITWYIMTSKENNEATINFFEKNNYFGYPKESVKFFIQGELPMISLNGKILMEENGYVKFAANGHGGTLSSMEKSGVIDEMKKNGIEWVFINGVDNVLVKPVDPLLIGMSIHNKVLGAVKSIEKTDPKEKVGVFCRKNKKVGVVEYTEISDEMAHLRDDYGSLVYGDANAIFHLYNIKGLEKVSSISLPYHTAIKKASYLDENGKKVIGNKPNAYKFEMFIFDSYEIFDDVVVLRVKREEEFAPIKNAEGQDSPETARKLYRDYVNKVEYMKKYQEWSTSPIFDEETRKELLLIAGDEEEIKDRFYKDLEFGTAGMRGVIGNGTNRMNVYTVTKATQGLANYILNQGTESKGVVIAYDSRNKSPEFAECTALCLNANGIKTYIFESLRPVPELSFAVRELGCTAGIIITASHNPPEYNGYKVYWEDGAQVVPPHDKGIIAEVNKVKDYSLIREISKEEAMKLRLYNIIGPAMDKLYLTAIKKQILNPDVIKKQKDLKIVYTPLHGAGNMLVQKVLSELGFENVYVVPEQELPNGSFPTVEFPNPEDPRAFELALKLANKIDADVVLATDPDSDRLGVYAKNSKTGEYKSFTGNMSALLIAEYVLSQKKEKKLLPKNGALISTIVSSNLAIAIAEEYKVNFIEVLTGFKYIGEQIKKFEEDGSYEYLFGFEESYGCLVGTHARDKDGITAVMLLCEAAAYYKTKGLSLWDKMNEIYKKYGYYKEDIFTITLKGADGAEKMKEIMDTIRNNPPAMLGEYKVKKIRDYKSGIIVDTKTKEESKTGLPISNVLYYDLEENSWCCVRPSGTEPKIKFYMGIKGKSMKDSEDKIEALKKAMIELSEQ